jgi:hypothetical protein
MDHQECTRVSTPTVVGGMAVDRPDEPEIVITVEDVARIVAVAVVDIDRLIFSRCCRGTDERYAAGMLSAEDRVTVEAAREHALSLVHANAGVAGMRAGGAAYPEVWVRDAVITGVGVAAIGDDRGRRLLRQSVASVRRMQSRLGRIPNHVYTPAADAEMVADTVFGGAVDASLWFIIAHHVLGDGGKSRESDDALARAYQWLEYQDVNERGLLEVHESMDWADLFANRYASLLPNVLWYAANRAMAALARHDGISGADFDARAENIRFRINQLLWVGPEVERDEKWIRENRREWEYPTRLVDTVLGHRPYYLPYMAFREFGDRFDTLGNLLAVLFGIADRAQAERILSYVDAVGLDQPWPVKACWPPTTDVDKDWREYYRLYNSTTRINTITAGRGRSSAAFSWLRSLRSAGPPRRKPQGGRNPTRHFDHWPTARRKVITGRRRAGVSVSTNERPRPDRDWY